MGCIFFFLLFALTIQLLGEAQADSEYAQTENCSKKVCTFRKCITWNMFDYVLPFFELMKKGSFYVWYIDVGETCFVFYETFYAVGNVTKLGNKPHKEKILLVELAMHF